MVIVELDTEKYPDVLQHVCNHLYKEWAPNYKNFYNIQNSKELVAFYKSTPKLIMYVALDENGKFKGCYSMTKKGHLYWLTDMYVIPAERGKGIGRMLVEHAIKDCDNVALNAEDNNIIFYEKFGFKQGLRHKISNKEGFSLEYTQMLYTKQTVDNQYILLISIIALIGLGVLCFIMLL